MYGNKRTGTKKECYSGGIRIYFKNVFQNDISVVERNKNGIVMLKLDFDSDLYICAVDIPPSCLKVLFDKDF